MTKRGRPRSADADALGRPPTSTERNRKARGQPLDFRRKRGYIVGRPKFLRLDDVRVNADGEIYSPAQLLWDAQIYREWLADDCPALWLEEFDGVALDAARDKAEGVEEITAFLEELFPGREARQLAAAAGSRRAAS